MTRKYFSITELSEITGLPAYKIRYAEKNSPTLKASKVKNRNYYSKANIEEIIKTFELNPEETFNNLSKIDTFHKPHASQKLPENSNISPPALVKIDQSESNNQHSSHIGYIKTTNKISIQEQILPDIINLPQKAIIANLSNGPTTVSPDGIELYKSCNRPLSKLADVRQVQEVHGALETAMYENVHEDLSTGTTMQLSTGVGFQKRSNNSPEQLNLFTQAGITSKKEEVTTTSQDHPQQNSSKALTQIDGLIEKFNQLAK